jgi:cytochrome b6-f complex iron-sulfur subunit
MAHMQRRRFLQVSVASVAGLGLGACGDDGGGGADVPEGGLDLGTLDEVRANIADGGGTWEVPDAGVYLVEVDASHREALAAACDASVRPGIDAGFVALGRKCPHQGCRVPFCTESQWFECPCHGSRFSTYGELRRGPSDDGMFQLPLELDGDVLRLLPGSVNAPDDDVTGIESAGPHCV